MRFRGEHLDRHRTTRLELNQKIYGSGKPGPYSEADQNLADRVADQLGQQYPILRGELLQQHGQDPGMCLYRPPDPHDVVERCSFNE